MERIELPPADLPVECAQSFVHGWTEGQVRDYAARCVESDRAECESLRRDAERYRWLRNRVGLDLRSTNGKWTRPDGTVFEASHYLAEGGTQHSAAESLDATIDAAMKGG
jgi:hypothetical protein